MTFPSMLVFLLPLMLSLPSPLQDPAPAPTGEAASPPAWDVDRPELPTREQPIDTTEGTWMNLDVSPDGRTIAFDLLGDLYLLPLEGGEPRRLTSGISWDMQPRFSPDGQWIAFTSDRTGQSGKGGDNLWVVGAGGEGLRQITEESYRLLSGPAWHPSGDYLVGRKHFTSRRSLGAGEMWMYHVGGVLGGAAEGLQLTERPTDQKDVNEPVFDPTGRYLYYSMDATSGQAFEYDKDSNKQIYVVRRLDLETGEDEAYITGPGGACRPTPSPDGRVIAFVRRVGPRTGLHLFDTQSGAVRLLYDDLERDMQEAWAIHGVYPTLAWTPDGGSLVFWARGRIRRLEIESGEVAEIPFHVRDSRTVTRAQRVPIEVAPAEFDLKMLRWVQVAPDGRRVVFQALGHLYLRDLPEGEPRRLTEQTDHFEYCPSFSRDGRYVTYVAWDDEELSSVRVASVDGAERWVVTRERGHYRDPVFSPDGEKLVYQKTGGGWLTSPMWSRQPGLYRVAWRGGKPERLTRSGARPQFGASSERVFFQRSASTKDADNLKLCSVGMDGKEEREHFTSTWATDYRVSPDGLFLAFVERYHVYLAPLVTTGRSIAVGPDSKVLPLQRVTREAGEWIHFSSDGTRLYWSLGPTLFERRLEDAFAFLGGVSGELPEPPTTGTNLGFRVKSARPEGLLALVGGRLITMRGDEVIEDGVLVLDGNRIAAVGARSAVQIPAGARVVDLGGRTVLPGFVDVHAHGSAGEGGFVPEQNWVDQARLAFGVTTVHDPSNDTQEIFASSEMGRAGVITAPRTFSTGTILYGATGAYKAEIDSLDDARFHLRRMQAVGAFSVKSYNQPRRDQRQQVMSAARELDMMVVPEGGSTFMHNLTHIVDGHTGLEHTLPVEIVYDDVLDLWRDSGVGYTPTLGVAYGGLGGENYWYQVDELWQHPRLSTFLPPHVLVPRSKRRTMAPEEDYNHLRCARITKQVVDNGGSVQAGGHGQLNGVDTHWEMWMFVQGGMTQQEALRSGTLSGAEYLGLDGDLGSLEAGKLADVVVLEEGRDPLADIRATEHVHYVIANGRLFDARTMTELTTAGDRPRASFYWERDDFGIGLLPAPPTTGCQGCGRPGPADWMRRDR